MNNLPHIFCSGCSQTSPWSPTVKSCLEVRGGVGEERRKNLCCFFTFKKRPPDRFQLTTTPLQFALLNLELTSRHFQTHVDTAHIPIPRPHKKKFKKNPTWVLFSFASNHFYKAKVRIHTGRARKQQTAPCQQRLLCAE